MLVAKREQLYQACERADLGAVQVLLLYKRININSTCTGSWTPLYVAAMWGHDDLIMALLCQGANVNAGPDPPLYGAVSRGFQSVAHMLLYLGADVNGHNDQGATALHVATVLQRADMITLLLNAKANIDCENHFKGTPLFCAVTARNGEMGEAIVQLLIDARSNVNHVSQHGHTPFGLAADVGSLQICQRLIDAGADLNWRESQFGNSALHRMVCARNVEMVSFLLRAGADFDVCGRSGLTPRQMAVARAHREMIDLLDHHAQHVNQAFQLQIGLLCAMANDRVHPHSNPFENEHLKEQNVGMDVPMDLLPLIADYLWCKSH